MNLEHLKKNLEFVNNILQHHIDMEHPLEVQQELVLTDGLTQMVLMVNKLIGRSHQL